MSLTLDQAIDILFGGLEEGIECPCCGQFAKIYKRTVNSGMARSLITMYKASGREWQHVPTTTDRASREEGKLAYWGLLEESEEVRTDGGRAGWWRVTEDGEKFVKGCLSIPKYAYVYNGEVVKLGGDKVFITKCLGKGFIYRELMAA
jgi:hypothetical protein